MGIHRLRHTFTAGEISPMMADRVDFERHKDGCEELINAVCVTQGPADRRPGFRFIYDIGSLGQHADAYIRLVPFVYDEVQAYVLIFFFAPNANVQMAVACDHGLVLNSEGTAPYVLDTGANWDLRTFDYAQTGDDLYIAERNLAPRRITRFAHNNWSFTALSIISAPASWAANNWPERVTFHQQRLAFASTLLDKQTIWCSKAGSFLDFGISSPLLDSDAVTFTLASGEHNRIQWLQSSKALNVGTLGNEWTVLGGVSGALSPKAGGVLATRQTSVGSEPYKPLMVGMTTLFVERHGRTISEFTYDYAYDSYKTSDITILAPHLTESYSITTWAYQQAPDSIIWCTRSDGVLLGLTYQREHKVVGWHRHYTDGAFQAVCCIPGQSREDEVWVIVQRVIGGVYKQYLEKMAPRPIRGTSPVGLCYVDSYVSYPSWYYTNPMTHTAAMTDTIAGLGHLEGEEVSVLANGLVHPPVTVENGTITLNDTYTNVIIGLPYETKITPHLPDISISTGTTLGRTQRITKLDIDLYKTLGGIIARTDADNGVFEEELLYREESDTVNAPAPLFTGWKMFDFFEGFNTKPTYSLIQRQPLPLTVRCVVDTIEVYE